MDFVSCDIFSALSVALPAGLTAAFSSLTALSLFTIAVLALVRWKALSVTTPASPPGGGGRGGEASLGLPRLTLVIPTHNQAEQLERLLPLLFAQRYDGWFEVIVADQQSDDETEGVLIRAAAQYDTLRTTFVPQTSRYIDHHKLAVTLGIKAAYGTWAVIVSPAAVPASDLWLANVAQALTDDTDLVEIFSEHEETSRAARRANTERLLAWTRRAALLKKGTVSGCERSGWGVRRALFLEQGGFADSVTLSFGEEAIFANRHAETERTRLLCAPAVRLREDTPSRSERRTRRELRYATLPHLSAAVRRHALLEGFATLCLYLYIIGVVVYVALRALESLATQTYALAHLWSDVTQGLLLLVAVITPALLLRRTQRALGLRPRGRALYAYALTQPWRNLNARLAARLNRERLGRKF